MKFKATKPLCILLTLTILVGLVPIFHSAYAQAKPKLFISPADNTFYTDTTHVGDTFTVSIMSADFVAPGVFSYGIKLFFDPTMLQATVAAIPAGHWLTPVVPANIFPVDSGTIDNTAGFVTWAVTLLGTEAGKVGGGVIATVTFKISAAPPAGGSLTSSIALGTQKGSNPDTILVDPTASPIPGDTYDIVPATFTYAAPPPPWYLKITPELVAASSPGDSFKINVSFLNVQATGRIVGVQFRVVYPQILVAPLELTTEGSFFKSFGTTFFIAVNDTTDAQGNPSVFAAVTLVPGDNGQYPAFADGNGTLATITFKVMAVPATLTTFPLTLTDVIIVDADGNTVPYRRLENAALMAPSKPQDLNGDGKVDILDLSMFAVAFGSTPDSPRWNAKADINRDNKVNILDGVIIAVAFGDPR